MRTDSRATFFYRKRVRSTNRMRQVFQHCGIIIFERTIGARASWLHYDIKRLLNICVDHVGLSTRTQTLMISDSLAIKQLIGPCDARIPAFFTAAWRVVVPDL